MNTHLPSRTFCLVLVTAALAGTTTLQSASAPVLTIERLGETNVLLAWTNDGPGFVLQGLNPLGETGSWQTVPVTPQLLEGRLGVTLPIQTNDSQFFRLKARGVEFTNHQEVLCWQSDGTFDASNLLSAESIKDPFQLNWAISANVVGATISAGGVVNLGTDAGSFTVTASATNPACEDSFTLQTIRLEFTNVQSLVCWQANGSFDAHTLLSSSSTTNDSLLDWLISGTGPASIDALGLISLGPGGGNYVVQAAARSNATCAASFGLEVLKLEFATNAAATCWQSNGTFDAKARLTPGSTTNESLVDWTIAGSGPATIDGAGLVSLRAGPGSYSIAVSGRSNPVCAAVLNLEVIKLELATNAATVCWQSNGTYDVKALLTIDSVTNDNLPVWTIVGSGPASIDSAGLVSFGPGAGSYAVQVTDQSNRVCVPSLALDVVRLEFATNTATVCWQSNGTFNAKALLSLESTTNDSLLDWSMAGNGSATIDGAGLVSLGAGPGSYTIAVSGRSNTACAAALALEVVKLELTLQAATVCWQSNGIFNARELLSSDSITNDRLLVWSITGTGPATIDNAGLVSVGPAPGSYLVQVIDRDNAVCAQSLGLDVVKLEFATNAATLCWQSNRTFNARELLTADSTINDSLLNWSIVGSGPAIIDGAGLVSFGPGAGSYSITVSGWNNAVCAVALVLEVIKLELATNAATVCWQSNGTVNAKALLTSDSLTNDSLLAWTISGSGAATIDSAGLVSVGPAPGSYLVQVTDSSNAVCVRSLGLEVIKLEPVANTAAMCWQSNGTFDAKALLTPDSTTNDSLVAWAIVGSGPAMIDSAGLVSFGSGPGNYTVQVSGRSNATCAAAFGLEVLRLEFTTNAAAVCWQSNGTFNAKALLTADSTANASLLAWTIGGSGPATIDSAGLVSLGAGPGSYTVQVAGRNNAACAAALALEVIKLELATNAATVCWQSNGTFDVKALLTTGSVTNDSLLAWTIFGDGPATIDSAGLVSLGAAPGSYTVQVTDQSNRVCVPSLALDVVELDFATNEAAVCWQSNGTFDAKALLTGDSTTNDTLLEWTIGGTGPATIDGAGLVSLGASPGSYTIQVSGRSNAVCAATLALGVIKLELVTNAVTVCWQSNGTFNAKALLTTGSTSNDSVLAWTILGSGPASVDSAGLVSFGSGPGSYTVQVSGRSNGLCAVSLALDMLHLELATNAASVCWQPGGMLNAKALLTAGSTTNDSLVAWAIVGSGPATIDSAGLVSFGPGPGSYTVQVSGRSNATCVVTLGLEVLKLEFATNGATVCWQSNGMFNAKALLTPGSTTNDSQVTWAISGSPLATIDSTGVVRFGSGPGDYTVQVAGRTNATCMASFGLKVLELEFVASEATVCWQSNGTFNAKAQLTAGSTTNDNLVVWSISGSPAASIDSAGMVTFGSAAATYTVQVAARSNAVCSASFTLRVIRLEFGSSQAATCWQSNGTYSAKAMLTTNSSTDDSLLQWTISGSPPASIDGSGVVTLGSGAGNYAVRVAARSNAACTAALSLGVSKVDFVKNQAIVAWQSGGTFDARVLLALDGITNAASLNWSISGSPSATINTSGVVTLGSGGGSYTIQTTAKGALACSDTLTLSAVEVHLKSISFVSAGAGNGGTNQNVLYENADPQNWGDGGAITNPVWIAGTNSQPVRNAPACYTCSGAAISKARAQVIFNVKPASQTFNFIGLDRSTEYFRTNGILSTGADRVIDVIASVPLTNTVQKLTKTFTWQAVFPYGASNVTCNAGQSTNTIYTIYGTPITYVEGQTNNPTPYRLDFCIVGVAEGLSNKVAICSNIAAAVRSMTGDSYGGMTENPRWTFYAEPLPRDLDCHHRAALAASGFGVLGIQGYVHRTFSTCYPVPAAPQYYPTNTTVNDYMGTYTGVRLKYRQVGSEVDKLAFLGNNFEGCVRVEDGSSDDGNTWWTIWPLAQHQNAKALLIWYTATNGCYEQWQTLSGTVLESEDVPVDYLADKPKVIGGPD